MCFTQYPSTEVTFGTPSFIHLAAFSQRVSRRSSPSKGTEAEPETEDEVNAQFLIGLTRSCLSKLAGITQEKWVHRQMELPVESHRAYYRQRVNPLSSSKKEVARGPCDAGSRWSQFVLRLQMSRERQNRGLQFHLCCTVFRSDIELGQLHSRMASAENFTGFICSVVPEIGAEVVLADTCLTYCRCRRKVIRVENPALWNTAGRFLKLRFNFVTYGLGTVSIFFVTSSATDFIRTEQGLHYKNIFVRNLLAGEAKVHFQFNHERPGHPQR